MDVLKIANMEHHTMRMQLEGIHQAWEAMNMSLYSVRAQLGGIFQSIEYLARMAWKRYVASHANSASGLGGGSDEGVMR